MKIPRVKVTLVRDQRATYCTDPVNAPVKIEQVLGFMRSNAREEFWAIYVNARHEPVGLHQVAIGTLSSTLVHPREVFGPALALGVVAAVIVAHNHPSGESTPSIEDSEITKRLIAAGQLLGVPLLDHVIIPSGDEPLYSFRTLSKLSFT